MIDTKALRSRVLDLAIQGKLTEQLESDGTAEELYQQIQAEKQRLVKEGKIKKEKALPEIKAEEVPFEIPGSWKWVQLGIVGNWSAGSTPSRNNLDYYGGSIPWLKTGDLTDGEINEVSEFITEKALAECSLRLNPIGSILIAMYGATIGKLGILNIPVTTNQACCACVPYAGVDNRFLFYYLLCERSNFISKGHGGAQPNISKEIIINSLIPLPPLAEQKRIVARVEEIFRLLDTIDEAQKQYAIDVESLKAKLITAGIQGKLTEQLDSDGTAEELYQQIQEEKQRLIKEGKIKKEKPLPEIKPEEVPFEIPGSWKWVRLNEICKSVMDGDHQPPPQTTEGMPFIVISNLSNGALDFSNTRHVSKKYFDSLSNERIAEQSDILFTVTGSFGIPIKVETDQQFCFQRHIALLKQLDSINTNYLLHVLKSEFVYKQCDDVALGVAQRTVGIKLLRNFLIPLPPLAEQKRIVEKLDAVLGALS